ncbi:MAG: glycosyltransferase family 39 protein [Acidimicrobiia bacterium]
MGQRERGLDLYALPLAWAEAALALALGAITLGSKSLWFDEVYSVTTAGGSWDAMYRSWRHRDPNMSLYDVLLRSWRVLGTSDAAQRSLSVLATAATVLVVFAIGRRLFGPRVGLIAGLVIAIAPFAVHYAQEARSYALAALLVSLASYSFVVGIEDPRWLPWTGYAVFGALAIYAHFFAALVLVAHGASLFVLGRAEIPWRAVVRSGTALVVLALPAVWLAATGPRDQLSWIGRPDLHGAFWQPASMAGGTALSLVFLVLVGIAVWFGVLRWRSLGVGRESWRVAFVILWLGVPWALSLAYSLVFQPVFLDRYLIVSLPALALAAAIGASQLARQWAAVALMAVVALSAVQVVIWYRGSAQEDWRAVTAFTAAHAQPGDGIAFCLPELRRPFDYYARRATSPHQPRDVGAHAATWPDRVWLVRGHEFAAKHAMCGLVGALAPYGVASDTSFPGIQLQLYQRASSR